MPSSLMSCSISSVIIALHKHSPFACKISDVHSWGLWNYLQIKGSHRISKRYSLLPLDAVCQLGPFWSTGTSHELCESFKGIGVFLVVAWRSSWVPDEALAACWPAKPASPSLIVLLLSSLYHGNSGHSVTHSLCPLSIDPWSLSAERKAISDANLT
jgi:hypothetical protein